MYMLRGAPFKRTTSAVVDRSGEVVKLMGDSADIMLELTTDPKFEAVRMVSEL